MRHVGLDVVGSNVAIEGCIVGLSVGNGVVGSSEGSSDGLGVGCDNIHMHHEFLYYMTA